MTEAIVLDLGGVILDLDIEGCKERFRRGGITDIDRMVDACHHQGIFKDLESGRITDVEFCKRMSEMSGGRMTPREVHDVFNTMCARVPEKKIRQILEFKKQYPVYCLSNNNAISVRWFQDRIEEMGVTIYDLFDDIFCSYRLRMIKPERDIFDYAVKKIGLPAGNLLFIDDSPKNVEVAKDAGMDAVLYELGSDLGELISSRLSPALSQPQPRQAEAGE